MSRDPLRVSNDAEGMPSATGLSGPSNGNTCSQPGPNYAEMEFRKTLAVWMSDNHKDTEAMIKGWLAGLPTSSKAGLDSNLVSSMATDRASKETDTLEDQPYCHLRAMNVFKSKTT